MLYAVIMAGGSGTRFWPKSRRDRPKQLLCLSGETTMLQQTVARIEPLVPRDRILIVTGADQAEATRAQLPDLPAENVIAEPAPRDTAPCVGLAAGIVVQARPGGDDDRDARRPRDRAGRGVSRRPSPPRSRSSTTTRLPWSPSASSPLTPRPATATSSAVASLETATESPSTGSIQFREKPDKATAEHFLAAGNFVWNSGIFVWRAPHNSGRAQEAQAELWRLPSSRSSPHSAPRPRPRRWRGCSHRSSESRSTRPSWNKPPNVRVLEVPYAWNDVGDWRALASLLEHDSSGNATQGAVVARDTTGSIIISDDGGLIATLGVETWSSSTPARQRWSPGKTSLTSSRPWSKDW